MQSAYIRLQRHMKAMKPELDLACVAAVGFLGEKKKRLADSKLIPSSSLQRINESFMIWTCLRLRNPLWQVSTEYQQEILHAEGLVMFACFRPILSSAGYPFHSSKSLAHCRKG